MEPPEPEVAPQPNTNSNSLSPSVRPQRSRVLSSKLQDFVYNLPPSINPSPAANPSANLELYTLKHLEELKKSREKIVRQVQVLEVFQFT
ncbi:hypothetical protein COLO4_20763 [Corchorus olitorius]|uniref:Uncharacterized protein n=1 Tax=Corchorus olitorius TaxID=93759 RepID=A0A1R3IX79_9ROSI|nr:hypothetical protein COLO4_20763 [Corchorus olitorius]